MSTPRNCLHGNNDVYVVNLPFNQMSKHELHLRTQTDACLHGDRQAPVLSYPQGQTCQQGSRFTCLQSPCTTSGIKREQVESMKWNDGHN